MAEFLAALGQYPFLQRALLTGLLAAPACGIIGTFVVVRRVSFLAGGIAHTVLGGLGAAAFLGCAPLPVAIATALLAAIIIGLVSIRAGAEEDTLISALWAVGMAAGVLFLSRTPGYQSDLTRYLFGNILLVDSAALWTVAALDLVIIGSILALYRRFQAVCFDREYARLQGLPVDLIYLFLLCLVALTVVILVQLVGLILVIALLALPAAIAGRLVASLPAMMILATLLTALFVLLGLALSWSPDLPAGACIIVVTALVYLLVAGLTCRRRLG